MSYSPIPAHGQQFVTATVHLAGAVETETAHARWNSGAGHVMARVGGVLLYFLDRDAIAGFAQAAAEASPLGGPVFGDHDVHRLPAAQVDTGQDASLVLRLSGAQDIGGPNGLTGQTSQDGAPYVSLRVGGLRLMLRDRLALSALVQVAEDARRAGDALWPSTGAEHLLPGDRVGMQTR